MVPSATFSAPGEAPSLAAAADSRISRASAQANRNAVPLCSTDRLPAVCPSSGVSAVSPWTMAMRFRSRSSSSAAICDSAVPMPWPSSILPLKMVTLPFESIRSHASSMRLLLRLPGRRAGEAWGSASSGARLRSEEHTSELQSHLNLVCRLLLEKKKEKKNRQTHQKKNKKPKQKE